MESDHYEENESYEEKEEKAFDEIGSIAHINYYTKKFEIKEGNIGADIKLDEDLLKKALNLWMKINDDVYGEEYHNRILNILLNIQLKPARPAITLYRLDLDKKAEKDKNVNKIQEGKKCNKKIRKTNLSENAYRKKFGEKNSEDSDMWSKLDEETKAKYKALAKKERDIYNLEMCFIRYFLFIGINPETKLLGKLVRNNYVLFRNMDIYESYLNTGIFPEDYNIKKLEEEYNNLINEKDVTKINFNKGESFYKAIIHKQKDIIENAMNYKKKNVKSFYKEDMESSGKDFKSFQYLSPKEKLEYKKKKNFQQRENEIITNIKSLLNEENIYVYSTSLQLFEKDLNDFFNSDEKGVSYNIVEKLWKTVSPQLKRGYDEKLKIIQLASYYLKHFKETGERKKEIKYINSFKSTEKLKETINNNLDENSQIETTNQLNCVLQNIDRDERRKYLADIREQKKEHYKQIKDFCIKMYTRKLTLPELIAKFYKQEVLTKYDKENWAFNKKCRQYLMEMNDKQKQELEKIRRGVIQDWKNKEKQIKEKGAFKANILDNLYKPRKQFDVQEAKSFAIKLSLDYVEEAKVYNINNNNEPNDNENVLGLDEEEYNEINNSLNDNDKNIIRNKKEINFEENNNNNQSNKFVENFEIKNCENNNEKNNLFKYDKNNKIFLGKKRNDKRHNEFSSFDKNNYGDNKQRISPYKNKYNSYYNNNYDNHERNYNKSVNKFYIK